MLIRDVLDRQTDRFPGRECLGVHRESRLITQEACDGSNAARGPKNLSAGRLERVRAEQCALLAALPRIALECWFLVRVVYGARGRAECDRSAGLLSA